MTIGVQYSETYTDPNAEIWAYTAASGVTARPEGYVGPETIFDFLRGLKKQGEHGQAFAYKTCNTEVLAWIVQRVTALNLFLADIYHGGKILKDQVVPAALVRGNPQYRPQMEGFAVPHGTYVHVCGIDLVRDETGGFRVLEDNARTPSGVSYVVENRHMMLRTFAQLFDGIAVRPVDDYGMRLQEAMASLAPGDGPLQGRWRAV